MDGNTVYEQLSMMSPEERQKCHFYWMSDKVNFEMHKGCENLSYDDIRSLFSYVEADI